MSKVLYVTEGGADQVAARLIARLGSGLVKGEVFKEAFPDGETYHRLVTDMGNREAVVVGDFATADSAFELFDVASLLADEGALGLTIVLPEDKRTGKQARFLKRVRNRMLSAIPPTPLGNRVLEVEPSCPSIPFYDKLGGTRSRVRSLGGSAAVDLFGARGRAVVFSTKRYGYMQDQFHGLADFERGQALRDDDGIVKGLSVAVHGRDVVIIGGTIDHVETLDLYVMANAAYEAGALSLTLVVPYFGYSTMERGKPDLHEAIKATYRARLIGSIPRCPMGNRVVLCDLHAEGVSQSFGNGVRTTHLYCLKEIVLAEVEASLNGRLCTTDTGRAKWAESLVKDINKLLTAKGVARDQLWQAAIAVKDRKSGSETQLLGLLGDVAGLDIYLFDDMIRRGSTAIDAGKGYRFGTANTEGSGCKKIRFWAGHGVLPGTALQRLQAAVDHAGQPLFSEVTVTDSHPNAVALAGDFLKVRSIAAILVAHVVQSLAIEG
jgi:ribose-phosphate pyrophosphokinase